MSYLINPYYLLEEVFQSPTHHHRYSPIRVNENDQQIIINIDAPGFPKSDVSIEYTDNIVSISTASTDDKDPSYRPIHYQKQLPNIDFKKGTAELKDGVLTITLPILQPSVDTLRIS